MRKVELDLNYIIELKNNQKKNYSEISKILGHSTGFISRYCKENNVILDKNTVRIHSVNEDFFDSIDSEIKAYLLGYIAADGHVEKHYNAVVATATIADRYLINLLKEYIAPTANLRYVHHTKGALNRKPQVSIDISSTKLARSLGKYGIVPQKTNAEFTMENIPEEFKRDYIRGYFDGDGCIYVGKILCKRGYYHTKCCINFTNGTKSILLDIQSYLGSKGLNLVLESKISVKKREYFVLAGYSKDKLSKFLNICYKGSHFFLERKFLKFNHGNTELIKEIQESLTV